MRKALFAAAVAALAVFSSITCADHASQKSIQLGPRPFYLVDGMDSGLLKDKLLSCKNGPFYRTDFSIGHRGAALQFPEHTRESYQAAARMGAGIVECDVTFTRDGELVCRHGQNDLHTTTNILLTPLAATCIRPFTPAVLDSNGTIITPASAECRVSELTLDEFLNLQGKMDASNPAARTVEEYLGGTASWRTDLNTGRGTLMTFRDSIELNRKLGVKHTPELKIGDPRTIASVFGGQQQYAQRLADELKAADVKPADAWPQSFRVNDVLYWVKNTRYGKQAVLLVDYDAAAANILLVDTTGKRLEGRWEQLNFLSELRKAGVEVIAPSMPALLAVNGDRVVPSQFAQDLKALKFKIITWTLERTDLRQGAAKAGSYYAFDPAGAAIKKDSDMYKALDVLAKEVGVVGVFSDWPATVSYYASCMNLK